MVKKYDINFLFNKFINKSNILHNNFYCYDKSIYINARTNIKIICPTHGEFNQLPYNHLMGKGCSKCGIEKNRILNVKSKEDFIIESSNKHNNKYNYSNVEYINDSIKVEIICNNHGKFLQSPNKHLRGEGCKKCGKIKSSETFKNKYSSIFLQKNIEIHNNKYDYSMVKYINSYTKIEIICKIHGSFFQIPYNHSIGNGCPKCNHSHGERKIESYLLNSDIKYECQKKFEDCININRLSFDFWVENKNLLIEFDGEQHTKPLGYQNGGIKKLNYTIKCDNIKNDYCFKNKINLLRISYLDIDNINNILPNYLS